MGWNHTIRIPEAAVEQEIRQQIGADNVVALQEAGGHWYAAVKDFTGAIGAYVILVDMSDPNRIGMKIMSEAEGPFYYGCPKMILNLLDRAQDIYEGWALDQARRWRACCRVNL